jgi:prolyl-tRNA synthetase
LITHGDDKGFVIPPRIAPIQVVIIPIPYKETEEQINKTCEDVAIRLEEETIKVELDLRTDLTPGAKFYYWERRGVPIRIEIGPRDVKQNEVTIVRRNTLEKQNCLIEEVAPTMRTLIEEITEDLRRKAWKWMCDHVRRVDSIEEAKQWLIEKKGVVEVLWCHSRDCGLKLEEETNARILGVPSDLEERVIDGKCISCGRKATNIVRVALAY